MFHPLCCSPINNAYKSVKYFRPILLKTHLVTCTKFGSLLPIMAKLSHCEHLYSTKMNLTITTNTTRGELSLAQLSPHLFSTLL